MNNHCLLACLIAVFAIFASSISTSDYCIFEDTLKDKLRSLKCLSSNLNHCATQVRKIAQDNLPGSWGAILVSNRDLILNEKIDWYIHSINPYPNKCRLMINDTIVLEVFRTGYRQKEISDNKWIWHESKSIITNAHKLEICPHSALRELIAGYSHPGSVRLRGKRQSRIYAVAKSLAQAFYTETGHNWDVFVTRNASQNYDEIGFNLPHYLYDSRSGICMGETIDEYTINASIIGFEDEHQEVTSNG